MKHERDTKGEETSSVAAAVHDADIAMGRSLAAKRNHPVVRWCCGVGDVGDQGPLYLIGASTLIAGLFRKSPRCALTGASILVGVGLADVTKSCIKRRVKRSRPHALLDDDSYQFELGGSGEKKEQSFPSGHVAGTVAASRAVSQFYPAASPYASTTAAVITLSRVIKGKHWPLDLAAGVVIGIASNYVTRGLINVLVRPFLPRDPWRGPESPL